MSDAEVNYRLSGLPAGHYTPQGMVDEQKQRVSSPSTLRAAHPLKATSRDLAGWVVSKSLRPQLSSKAAGRDDARGFNDHGFGLWQTRNDSSRGNVEQTLKRQF